MARHPQLVRRILWAEALVLLAVVLYYELGTYLFRAIPDVAHANARNLWALEQSWGLFVEPAFQQFFQRLPALMGVLVFFYVGPHFALTLGFIAWAYWYRFPSYPEVRDSFVSFTLFAFGFQWILPLSPPRFIPESGLADTLDQTLPVNGNTPWIMQLTNPYAALPSVHFGWALLVALLAIRLTTSPHRWWWLLYPSTIALSIFATGNHWILDVVLSGVFLAATEGALAARRRHWTTLSSAPKPAPTPVAA